MSANGLTARCGGMAVALSALAAIVVLGVATPRTNAKGTGFPPGLPIVKVRYTASATKAPNGTITARLNYKTRERGCLGKPPPYDQVSPFVELLLPTSYFHGYGDDSATAFGDDKRAHFRLGVVGRGAWALTIPAQTDVTYDEFAPPPDDGVYLGEGHATTSKAYRAFVGGYLAPSRKGYFWWYGKSKKLGRVVCNPKPEKLPVLGFIFDF